MIDTHVHITTSSATAIHHGITMNEYIAGAMEVGITKAYAFLNPFINGFLCPHSPNHKVGIIRGQGMDECVIKCVDCGCTIYKGKDMFYSHNLALADECRKVCFPIHPIAFLAMPYSQLDRCIAKYELTGLFAGYKLHPTICRQSPKDIPGLSCNRPIIIHSGVGQYENPEFAIDFARNYSGPVVIAHCARFNKAVLNAVREMDNVWIDTGPFTFLWTLYQTKPRRLYLQGIESCSTPNDLFYKVIEIVGEDKIIFASDEPFGDLKKEVDFIKTLMLTPTQYNKITYLNAMHIFEI